jgi:hypothetical protein
MGWADKPKPRAKTIHSALGEGSCGCNAYLLTNDGPYRKFKAIKCAGQSETSAGWEVSAQ